MILITHSVIAAAVVKGLGVANPALAFAIGMATHYLSDTIPHWSYQLSSVTNEEHPEKREWDKAKFLGDAAKFSLDGLAGLAVVLIAVQPSSLWHALPLLLAAIGGCFPDALQALYITIKLPVLHYLQTFHDFMHAKIRLEPYPLIGIPFQLAIFLFALYLLR